MAVATSSIMNRKLKILVIESRTNTYSSSSYKISTVQVNSYKAYSSPRYKVCREIVVLGTFSQRRLLREEVLREENSKVKASEKL